MTRPYHQNYPDPARDPSLLVHEGVAMTDDTRARAARVEEIRQRHAWEGPDNWGEHAWWDAAGDLLAEIAQRDAALARLQEAAAVHCAAVKEQAEEIARLRALFEELKPHVERWPQYLHTRDRRSGLWKAIEIIAEALRREGERNG